MGLLSGARPLQLGAAADAMTTRSHIDGASRDANADEGRSARPLDGLRILVVDADDERRALLTDIARNGGATVRAAASRLVARNAIEAFEPDTIFAASELETVRETASALSAIVVVRTASSSEPVHGAVLELPFTSPRVIAAVTDAIVRLRKS